MNERPDPALLALRFTAGFAALAVVPGLLWAALPALGIAAGELAPDARHEWGMAGYAAAAVFLVAFAHWQRPAVPWRPIRAAAALGIYIAVLAPWVLFLVGYLAVARRCGVAIEPQAGLEYLAHVAVARPGFWVTVFATCLGAPLAEEIVFRGYLQGALQQVLPRWAAILAAASVFGAVHGLPYALPVGLLGVAFGYVFARTGSLWPSVLVHAAHNTLTVAVTMLWPGSLDLLYRR